MNRKVFRLTLISLLIMGASAAIACEYKAGETKYADYAMCRYGKDSIQVIKLPDDAVWNECVYYLEVFRPPKLLAVTRIQDGIEKLSINDRTTIGNPCYLTKQYCDAALKNAGF